MAARKQTYEQAMKRLEEIVAQIERNELGIDQLSSSLKEAEGLLTFCREKLYSVDKEIKQLLQENE
ncbi:MAG: exodeoxyribonuclease VII small subunit [Phocaeicola sp.]